METRREGKGCRLLICRDHFFMGAFAEACRRNCKKNWNDKIIHNKRQEMTLPDKKTLLYGLLKECYTF